MQLEHFNSSIHGKMSVMLINLYILFGLKHQDSIDTIFSRKHKTKAAFLKVSFKTLGMTILATVVKLVYLLEYLPFRSIVRLDAVYFGSCCADLSGMPPLQ
jgi:hypothetical protein